MAVKEIDTAGLMLCNLQAQAFELSKDAVSCSSEIFMRRFMNSKVAKLLDSGYAQNAITTPKSLLPDVEEQYGATSYGTIKYTGTELFWIYLPVFFLYLCAVLNAGI